MIDDDRGCHISTTYICKGRVSQQINNSDQSLTDINEHLIEVKQRAPEWPRKAQIPEMTSGPEMARKARRPRMAKTRSGAQNGQEDVSVTVLSGYGSRLGKESTSKLWTMSSRRYNFCDYVDS